jgi:hypothetical protein
MFVLGFCRWGNHDYVLEEEEEEEGWQTCKIWKAEEICIFSLIETSL